MSGLKACPFCGGNAELVRAGGAIWISCQSCGSHGQPCTVRDNARDDAAAAWNRRTPPAMPTREDVARIIDPGAWVAMDHALERFHQEPGTSSKWGGPSWLYECAYVAGMRTEEEVKKWLLCEAPTLTMSRVGYMRDSLKKTDAVLALIGGKG